MFGHTSKLRAVLSVILYAVVTAVVTLSLAALMSGASKDLANRVDRNAAVAKAGVDTVLCVLLEDPEFRTVETVLECAELHGFSLTGFEDHFEE